MIPHGNCPFLPLHSSIRREFWWLVALPEEQGGGRWLRRHKPLRDTLPRGKPMKIMTHLTPYKMASTRSFPRSVKKHHALASNRIGHARLPPVYVENFMHPKHEIFQHNMLGGSRFLCAAVLSKKWCLSQHRTIQGGQRKFESSGTHLQRVSCSLGTQRPLISCAFAHRSAADLSQLWRMKEKPHSSAALQLCPGGKPRQMDPLATERMMGTKLGMCDKIES